MFSSDAMLGRAEPRRAFPIRYRRGGRPAFLPFGIGLGGSDGGWSGFRRGIEHPRHDVERSTSLNVTTKVNVQDTRRTATGVHLLLDPGPNPYTSLCPQLSYNFPTPLRSSSVSPLLLGMEKRVQLHVQLHSPLALPVPHTSSSASPLLLGMQRRVNSSTVAAQNPQ